MLFDGAINSFHYKYHFSEYFCTLAMVDAMFQGGVGNGLDQCMKHLLGREGKTDIIGKVKNLRTEQIPDDLWAQLVTYANEDLTATQDLYYGLAHQLPDQEHAIMHNVLKMFLEPQLVFNEKVLFEAVKEADEDREERISHAIALGATVEILKGNKLFPDFLRARGIQVPMKPNPKGIMIPAFAKTDMGFQQMLESKDNEVRHLAQGRLAVKSTQATTRAYRFKKLHEEVECCPVAYNYARAHTWRLSGANKINLANLKRGSKLRTCIEAPKAHVLVVADASQIECRGNGYLAGQLDLLELFREGRDPYNNMASIIFGRTINRKGNPDHFFEGFLGKTATLGLGFQMGGPKFKYTVDRDAKINLGLDVDFDITEANRIVYDVYRPKNWKIVEFWEHCKEFLFCMMNNQTREWEYPDGVLRIDGPANKIFFPNGTWLYYPGLDWSDGQFTYLKWQGYHYITKYIYGGLLCENIVQKFARDITSHHLVQIAERYPVVLHTYDENVASVPEAEADEALAWMLDLMKTPPAWAASLPLDAEGGWAKEYSK
jgi:DNA polymerase